MQTKIRENRAATHGNVVALACDDGHLPFACFAAKRILKVEPGPFDVAICMPSVANVPQRFWDGPIRFVEVDFSALPELPMVKDWISFGTYYRHILPATFHGEYDTILYLDTDTYLRRPGLADLFASVRGEVALAAVTDFQRFVTLDANRERKVAAKLRDLGGKNGEYYNAGVLLFQPGPYLAMDGLRRFAEAAKANVKFLPIHRDQDQGALNLAFADDIVPMNPLYNWCSRDWLNDRWVEHFDPIILHFAGPGKPWNLQDDPFIASFSEEYRAYLGREFPEVTAKAAQRSAAWRYENPRHRVKLLEHIRVALYRRRFAKRLERARNRDLEGKPLKMQAAIDAAVVG